MIIMSAKIVFGIAGKRRVSTLAKTFVITHRKLLVTRILPLIMFTFFSTECKKYLKVQSKQKALLLVQNMDTRWNSTYLMLKRLKILKHLSGTMWLTIKMIKIRILKLNNDNLLDTLLYCSNFFCNKGM